MVGLLFRGMCSISERPETARAGCGPLNPNGADLKVRPHRSHCVSAADFRIQDDGVQFRIGMNHDPQRNGLRREDGQIFLCVVAPEKGRVGELREGVLPRRSEELFPEGEESFSGESARSGGPLCPSGGGKKAEFTGDAFAFRGVEG